MENKGGDESSCGPRDEIRSCRLESCFSWRIRDEVAGCRLTDVHSKCGLGTQDRIIECIRWDGVRRTCRIVEISKITQFDQENENMFPCRYFHKT